MAKRIERFEDFIAWQKARKLTSEIYKVTNHGEFGSDFGLKNQIRRAAVSSMSNLAEGFERGRQSFISSSQSRKAHALNYEANCMLPLTLVISTCQRSRLL